VDTRFAGHRIVDLFGFEKLIRLDLQHSARLRLMQLAKAHGLPAGAPTDVVRRRNAEVVSIMQSAEIQKRLLAEGVRLVANTRSSSPRSLRA